MAMLKQVLSFDAGELSPWLDSRTDLAKYAAGCRTLENFIVRPQGGISKRPGMEFRGLVPTGATTGRLVEFEIKGADSVMLVLGGLKMKVFAAGSAVQSGGSDLAVTIPWADADLPALRWKQLNDVMFFVHPAYAPQKLTRTNSTTWTVAPFIPLAKSAFLPENLEETWRLSVATGTTTAAWSVSHGTYNIGDLASYNGEVFRCKLQHVSSAYNSTSGYYYTPSTTNTYGMAVWELLFVDAASVPGQSVTLTASKATWLEAHEGSLWELSFERPLWDYEADLSVSALGASPAVIYSKILITNEGWNFTTFGRWQGIFSIQTSTDRGATWKTIRSWQSAEAKMKNVSGSGTVLTRSYVRIAFTGYLAISAGSSDLPYGNLKVPDIRLKGIVKVTDYLSATSVTAETITPVIAGTTDQWSEGAWGAYQGYPGCLELHQNRLLLAATTRSCHTIWGSAVDDYNNFYPSTDADEPFRHTVMIGQREPIVWMASDRQLVIGSGIGEFAMRGEREDSAITPEFGLATRQSSFGTQPAGVGCLLLDSAVLFVQNGGRIIREMQYRMDSDRYEAANLTLLSDHLFTASITDWAIQRRPFQILWIVAGGVLYSLTYERTQNIAAWQRHPTAGVVHSVACVKNVPDDEVWFVMQHGSAGTVERLTPSAITTPVDTGHWSDCWQTLAHPFTLTGNPLAGLSVVGWRNGVAMPAATLNSAFFTGITSGSVVVGRPYTAAVEPMTPELPMPNGTSRTRESRIHSVVPSLCSSRGGKMGQDPDGAVFDDLNVGSASALFTGEVEKLFDGGYGTTGDFCILSDEPFPFSIRSITLKMNFYGDG